MTVLVDIGNTRLKWGRRARSGIEGAAGAVHAGAFSTALSTMFAALPERVGRIVVANVAGQATAEEFSAACAQHFGVQPEFVAVAPDAFGIRCAYAEPARLGVDRWVAMIAAHRRVQGPVCVVDAGTTVTFDALNAHGQHLGGLILIGARLAAQALDCGTKGIGATHAPGARPAGLALLGRDTQTAVAQAAMLSVSAALDQAVGAVAAELGAQPTTLLTGGDAASLVQWLATEVQTSADLVLEGLAVIAEQDV